MVLWMCWWIFSHLTSAQTMLDLSAVICIISGWCLMMSPSQTPSFCHLLQVFQLFMLIMCLTWILSSSFWATSSMQTAWITCLPAVLGLFCRFWEMRVIATTLTFGEEQWEEAAGDKLAETGANITLLRRWHHLLSEFRDESVTEQTCFPSFEEATVISCDCVTEW